jgi:hypothetical protein
MVREGLTRQGSARVAGERPDPTGDGPARIGTQGEARVARDVVTRQVVTRGMGTRGFSRKVGDKAGEGHGRARAWEGQAFPSLLPRLGADLGRSSRIPSHIPLKISFFLI